MTDDQAVSQLPPPPAGYTLDTAPAPAPAAGSQLPPPPPGYTVDTPPPTPTQGGGATPSPSAFGSPFSTASLGPNFVPDYETTVYGTPLPAESQLPGRVWFGAGTDQLASGMRSTGAYLDSLGATLFSGLDALAHHVGQVTGRDPGGFFNMLANYAKNRQAINEQEATRLKGGDESFGGGLLRSTGSAVSGLPIFAGAQAVLGPMAGLGYLGALSNADKGLVQMLVGAGEGMVQGGFLHVLDPAKNWVKIPAVAIGTFLDQLRQHATPQQALTNAMTMTGLSVLGPGGNLGPRETIANIPRAAMELVPESIQSRLPPSVTQAVTERLPQAIYSALPEGPRIGFQSKYPAVQQEAVDFLRQRGVTLRAGQLTGNKYLQALEASTAHMPIGSQLAEESATAQSQELQNLSGQLAEEAYPTPVSKYEAGQEASLALNKEISDLNEQEQEAYDRAWKDKDNPAFSEKVPVQSNRVPVLGPDGKPTGATRLESVYDNVNMPVDVRWMKQIARGELPKLEYLPAAEQAQSAAFSIYKKILSGPDFVSADQAEEALKGLKSQARQAPSPDLRNYAQGAAAAMIPRLQMGIDEAVAKTGQEAVDALRNGRNLHYQKTQVADIADDLRKEPVQAFGQMTMAKDAGVDFLQRIADKAPDVMPRLGRAWLDNVFDLASREGDWRKAQTILNKWNDLGDKTKALMFPEPEMRQNLNRFFLGQKITNIPINPSGTALVKAAQEATTNPLKWAQGALIGRLLFTPRGSQFLVRAMENPPQTAAAAAALRAKAQAMPGPPEEPPEQPPPTGGGPPLNPSAAPGGSEGAGPAPANTPSIGQRIKSELKRLWEEEEGSIRNRQRNPPADGDYSKHLAPAEGEPLSPLKPLQPDDKSLPILRRAAQREPGIGGPDNERTVFKDKDGQFVIGKITPQDWKNRVRANLSADEMLKARNWYRELQGFFEQHFGKDEGPKMALAWLSSQQNVSPSGGMTNVLRAIDMLRGMPKEKVAGLAEAKILAALKGEVPAGGYGAKLNDFVDSALGKRTRTWMGDDPRGGQPAVIDVWANRDVGKIDQKVLDYLKNRFGSDAVKGLKADGNAIGETDYEYGSRFYNNLVNHLNSVGFDGGGWTGDQVQAVGWTAMQKAMGAKPEFASDLVTKNTRRYAYETEPGAGAPILRQYPWHSLSVDQQAKVSDYVGSRVTDLAAKLTGAKITNRVVTRGAYQGKPTISVQMDVFASPETFRDFARAAGYLGQQSEVWNVRPLKSGSNTAYFIRAPKGLDTPEQQQTFWQKLSDRVGSHLVPGYSAISGEGTAKDGNGIFIVNPFSKQYLFERQKAGFKPDPSLRPWTGQDKAKIEAGIDAVEREMGLDVTATDSKVDLGASLHNWARKGKENGHIQALVRSGRSSIAEELSRHAPTAVQSWWKEAWDKFAGAGTGGTGGPGR